MKNTMKSTETKQRQAITWGRYSSDQQKDGDSKDRQDRLNRAMAKQLDIQIVSEYFDKAQSVKDGATDLFKKIIAELPKGVGIICENLDRISRGHSFTSLYHFGNIINDGHFIITSQDGKEYNQDNLEDIGTVLTASMSAILARSENNKRTKRVKESKANAVELARQGKPAPFGSWLPVHLKYNPVTLKYDLIEEKRLIIESIFQDYANGHGVQFIAKRLNKEKVPTFKRKVIGKWQKSTIFGMLRYEGLIGILNYKDERIVNAWPNAITEKLYYQVQAILKTNVNRHGKYSANNVNNILRGISKCKYCGSTMTVTKDNYIYCNGHYVGNCKCGLMVKYKEMEYAFAKWFVPKASELLLGKDNNLTTIEALTTKKSVLNQRIEQTITLLDSGLAITEIKSRLTKLETERNNLDNEISTVKANMVSSAGIPESIDKLKAIIDGITDNQEIRKQVSKIIPKLVKKVEVDILNKKAPSFIIHLVNDDKVTIDFLLKKKDVKHYLLKNNLIQVSDSKWFCFKRQVKTA